MKKILTLTFEQDNSEIHKEAHKARITKGKVKKKAEITTTSDSITIKIKPKCSK
jgi:hypothetical protein